MFWFFPLLEELLIGLGFFFSLLLFLLSSPSYDYSICHESWDQTKTSVPKPPHLENIWTLSWSLNYILHMAPAALD